MNPATLEINHKLTLIRKALEETGFQGIRLRGTDWFAWATAGGSNTVLLAAETGIAEVLVTPQEAWILTDEIEAQRLKDEEIFDNFQFQINPWADIQTRETFIKEVTYQGKVCSDKPKSELEKPLPQSLQVAKQIMLPSELERYREVGRLASEAMTEVLNKAQPHWTEFQLAGEGAKALWMRGLHPTLTLVAGERRLPLYRHATPKNELIGQQAMLVFCARGYGLYANLTRFVAFGKLSDQSASLHQIVREIEAEALNACQPGVTLNRIYEVLANAYQKQGFPQAIREHHQGGTTGYLSREIVANPTTHNPLSANMAVAWNPSLSGAKIEDTFVINAEGTVENLTFDPNFPSLELEGRLRPVPLIV